MIRHLVGEVVVKDDPKTVIAGFPDTPAWAYGLDDERAFAVIWDDDGRMKQVDATTAIRGTVQYTE